MGKYKASPAGRKKLRIAVLFFTLAVCAAILTVGVQLLRVLDLPLLPDPAATEPPAPTHTPSPTPTPVPELTLYGRIVPVTAERLDFFHLETVDTAPLLEAAGRLPNVRSIDLSGCTLDLDTLEAVRAAYPDANVLCMTQVGGRPCDSRVEVLDFSDGVLDLAEAERACRALPALKKLIFSPDCGYADEELAALNEAYPDIRVVWTVRFGRWSLRTDATCFSTLQSPGTQLHRYTSEDFLPLFRYCTDMVALDLGHNDLTDLSELGGLTRLKVLILADDRSLSDISPLAALTELEYLEIFLNPYLSDFSALHSMTKMVDMNLSYCPLSDLSFLANMPNLQNCWLRATHIPYGEWAATETAYPNVKFLWQFPGAAHSTIGGWRQMERNVAIRTAFSNWQYVEEFVSWDNVRYAEGAPIRYAQPAWS